MLIILSVLGCAFISGQQFEDRMDLDGDGVPRPDDCDDGDASLGEAFKVYTDSDGDGFGSAEAEPACTLAVGFATVAGDCDDTNPTAFPGGVEVCDGVDNDCDGTSDGDAATDKTTWYRDDDGDDYGVTADSRDACDRPDGYAALDGDCDDGDATVNPGEREVCDGRDEDCSGVADDPRWYVDADLDEYGSDAESVIACTQPDGYVIDESDCNDADPAINPAAAELCDPGDVDEDCDGLSDDEDPSVSDAQSPYADSDSDGFGDPTAAIAPSCDLPSGYSWLPTDCDDTRADVNPDAPDACYDGLDADCDGWSDDDCDQDGVDLADDCDDADPLVSPLQVEACGDDVDNDCDGELAGACDLFGAMPLLDADAILRGNVSYGAVTSESALIGDSDGDGTSDLVAGTYGTGFYVLHGPLSGEHFVQTEGCHVRNSDGSETTFDHPTPAGDLDGDGLADWIAGDPSADPMGSGVDDQGAVYVVSGASDSSCEADLLLYGERATYGFGAGLAFGGASDFTGDGAVDVAVGATAGSQGYGGVYVIPGPLDGPGSVPALATLTIEPAASFDYTGQVASFLGDLDGDGISELATGYPGTTVHHSNDGVVRIFLGGTSGRVTPDDADASVIGAAANDALGWAFAAGDADGDGADDFGLLAAGAAYLFSGMPVDGSTQADADVSIVCPDASSYPIYNFANVGDLSGDGHDDLGVIDSYYSPQGAADVYFTPIAGTLTTEDADAWLYDGYNGSASTAIQGPMMSAGDQDNDGFGDLLIVDAYDYTGLPGAGTAWIFFGG